VFWILYSKIGDWINGYILTKLVFIVLLFGIHFMIGEVEEIFRMKNNYHPHFLPPGNYKRGYAPRNAGR
jgi:uncharacterized membrane protein